jgi:uncharacterized protein YwqG
MDFSKLAKKTVVFSLEKMADTAVNTSKYGGAPALDNPKEWPLKKDGNRMPFLAQLNFPEIAQCKCAHEVMDLPKEGMLLLFVDPDKLYDCEDYFAFIYKKEFPASGLVSGAETAFEPHALTASVVDTYPHDFSATDAGMKEEELTKEVKDAYTEKYLFDSHHQLMGFPFGIQDDPVIDILDQIGELPAFKSMSDFPDYDQYVAWDKANREPIRKERVKIFEEKSKNWTFLWQIPSDYDLYGSWGDNGNIYVLIETERLRKGDFSELKLTWQAS